MADGTAGPGRGCCDASCRSLPVINRASIDELRDDTGDGFPRILQRFLDHLPERLAAVGDAWSQGRPVDVGVAAHKLKGLAATYGLDRFVAACITLEECVDGPEWMGTDREPLEKFLAEGVRARAALEAELAAVGEDRTGGRGAP